MVFFFKCNKHSYVQYVRIIPRIIIIIIIIIPVSELKMAHHYTREELADIHLVYGEARGNTHLAARLHRERFPARHHPKHTTFRSVHQRLRDTGYLGTRRPDAGARRTRRTPAFEEDVLRIVYQNPSTSTRLVARSLNASKSSVHRVLRTEQLYPFHLHKVQALQPADFGCRLDFCNWVLDRRDEQPDFVSNIIFTDEATFTRNGLILNHRNSHVYDYVQPHALVEGNHQHRFAINIWAGIIANHIIGPYLLPLRLNGYAYRRFLNDLLPVFLQDVPLNIRQQMWYQHDGAPPHFDVNVRRHLDNAFPDHWIGRGGPVGWPARSPDLNPLDFFLWGHLKSLVYKTPVETNEDLLARVLAGCDEIRNMPGIFERVQNSFLHRCTLCRNGDGGHIEQLLW